MDVPHQSEPPADTSVDAAARQIAMWRAMSASDKARLVASLSRAVDQMALAGIRRRLPHASTREQFLRLAILKLGPEVAGRVYPEATALVAS